MNPFVSCLCVTYNRPKLLKETLHCFLAQEYDNKELIIVNDQENLIYKFSHPQVKIYNFSQRFNSLGEKRNHAKKLASKKAKYVYWIDDDDIYYPNFLSHMVSEHEKLPDFDVIKPDITHFSTNNVISNFKSRNVGFPTASFKKEFSDRKDFEPLMFGSDQRYWSGAKIHRLSDEQALVNIRWGMGVYHVSGGSSDIGSEEAQRKIYHEVGKRGVKEKKEIITLNPELLEETKKYYKKY